MNPLRSFLFAAVLSALCLTAAPSSTQSRASVVFVSSDVADAELLAVGTLPGHEVVRLRSDADALDQIGRVLADREQLASVVLVSHGAPGVLQLGSGPVDTHVLGDRAAEIEGWRAALTDGADILLYGCGVGAGREGAAFTSKLARLTGADVAASTDATGGALDGDWVLERRVGDVTSVAPWSADVMTRWRHRLLTFTEGPDFANAIDAAAPVTLDAGANTIAGTIATPGDRQDNFLIVVPAGHRLTAASLTLDRHGGFVGSVTFNLSEVLSASGAFTSGFPFSAGSYYVQVITDFAVGNTWSMSFNVVSTTAVCGNGTVEASETCDDGNLVACDGCSPTCAVSANGCLVGASCVAEGAGDPTNPCRACFGAVSRVGYSPIAAGPCDDSMFCTVGDACNGAGACVGTPRICDDGDACTTDACNEDADACGGELICEDAAVEVDAAVEADAAVEVDAATDEDAAVDVDAAIAVDAATARDAGADTGVRADGSAGDGSTGVDAGSAPVAAAGCACRAGGTGPASGSFVMLGALGLVLALRRRVAKR